jgi:hypothetical protein
MLSSLRDVFSRFQSRKATGGPGPWQSSAVTMPLCNKSRGQLGLDMP